MFLFFYSFSTDYLYFIFIVKNIKQSVVSHQCLLCVCVCVFTLNNHWKNKIHYHSLNAFILLIIMIILLSKLYNFMGYFVENSYVIMNIIGFIICVVFFLITFMIPIMIIILIITIINSVIVVFFFNKKKRNAHPLFRVSCAFLISSQLSFRLSPPRPPSIFDRY